MFLFLVLQMMITLVEEEEAQVMLLITNEILKMCLLSD